MPANPNLFLQTPTNPGTAVWGPGGGATVDVQDEGAPVPGAPAGTLNFVGAGVAAVVVGDVATITIPGGGAGTVAVQDEGVPPLGDPASLFNFVGAGVTAAVVGTTATITITGSGGPDRSQFVWRPAGVADPANGIYTTWATVHAAALASGMQFKEIIVDAPGATAIITAGAFDMTGIQLSGVTALDGNFASTGVVDTSVGTTFTNWARGCRNMIFTHQGVAALLSHTVGEVMYFGPNAVLNSTLAEMVDITGGFTTVVYLDDNTLINDSGFEVFDVAVGNTVEIQLNGAQSAIDDDTIRGAGAANINRTAFSTEIGGVQTNLTGALTIGNGVMAYTPANGADWVDPDPTDMASAMDRVAAAVAGLLAAPIP